MKRSFILLVLLLSGCATHIKTPAPQTAPTVGFGGADVGFGGAAQPDNKLGAKLALSYPACVPGNGVQCTTPYGLWLPPHGYPYWDVPMNANTEIINAALQSAAGKPCTTIPNALQFNNSSLFGCTNPTYDPTANAFNSLNQYANNNQVTIHPTLPGNAFFGPVANAYFSNTYSTPLPASQGYSSIGSYTLFVDGGQNQSQDGYYNKPGVTPFQIVSQSNTEGSTNPLAIYNYQFGVGDTFGIFNLAFCYGGASAYGDEGCEAIDNWAQQGGGDYEGTTSGVTTGSTSISTTPTQGNGTQGAGRYLVDLNASGLITAGTINTYSTGFSTYGTVTGSGTSWPVSTVNTTLGTNVTAPGVATVTPGSMTGITTSSVLCIADGGNIQTLIPSSTTGSTFTATFLKPQVSTAIVMSGGLCGYYLGITADTVTSATPGITGNALYILPVIGSTSSTSLYIWSAATGQYRPYGGVGSGSYTLYPGAEVTHVNNGGTTLSNTLTVMPNRVAWVNGDTVDEPMYFALEQQEGNTLITRYFPTFGALSLEGRNYEFQGLFASGNAGEAEALKFTNDTPSNYYNSGLGRYAPGGLVFFGTWNTGLEFNTPPSLSAIKVSCSTCGNVGIFGSFATGGQDFFDYNQAQGSWSFSTGFSHHGVTFGADSSISSQANIVGAQGEFGTASNLLLYSQFPSGSIGSTWFAQGTKALASQTSNAAADPLGNMTAQTVVAPSLSGSDSAGQAQAVTFTPGTYYTISFCFRGHVGGEQMEFGIVGDSSHALAVTLTTSWACWSTPSQTVVSASSGNIFWVFDGIPSSGATADVAFGQLENTNYHGQYIPTTSTTASVTGMVATQAYVGSLAGATLVGANPQGHLIPATIQPTGAGAALTTGPTSSVANDIPVFIGTAGRIGDSGFQIPLVGTTGTITGTSLSGTCDSGTASVTGAVVGSPVSVSSTTGADVGGAFNVRGSVTSTGTVTVYVCGTGTPSSLAYNVVVF